jgi:hypothetical protein
MLKNRLKNPTLVVALFLFAFWAWMQVLVFVYDHSAQPSHQIRNDQTAGGDTSGDNKTEVRESLWQATLHDPVAFFTFALFISTTLLFITAIIQIRYLSRADNAMRRSANAAFAQAKTARDALIASNRPWVFTQPWPGTAKVFMNEEVHFEMEFHCYGNAPATVVELCVECSDKEPAGDIPRYTATAVPRNIGLAPGNRWWEKDIDGALFKTTWQRPYVFGFIRYRDQFGVHTSGFCTRLLPYERKGDRDPWVTLATAGTPAWTRFD